VPSQRSAFKNRFESFQKEKSRGSFWCNGCDLVVPFHIRVKHHRHEFVRCHVLNVIITDILTACQLVSSAFSVNIQTIKLRHSPSVRHLYTACQAVSFTNYF